MLNRSCAQRFVHLIFLLATIFGHAASAHDTGEMQPPAEDLLKQRAVDELLLAHAPYGTSGNPGFGVGIASRGRVLYARGYGDADIEQGVPISADSEFYVASVSKSFTGFAIALLARDGKVDLDAQVLRYLPWLPDFGRRITVRNLIQHTSGLRDYGLLVKLAQRSRSDWLWQEQALNLVRQQRSLAFEPGTQAVYSNTGYLLLGEIVRAVSGQSLREFTTERMFKPLGMSRTFFADDATEIIRGRVQSYSQAREGWRRSLLIDETVGGTGIVTTVEDMLKWLENFGSPVVGDTAVLQQALTPGRLPVGNKSNYAFGVMLDSVAGHRVIVLGGEAEAFRATGYYFPREGLAITVLANNLAEVAPGELARRIAMIYLGIADAPKDVPARHSFTPFAPDARNVREIAGYYLSADDGWSVRIEPRDGKWFWATTLRDAEPLYAGPGGTFCVEPKASTCYRFERDRQGSVTGFRTASAIPSGPGHVRFTRLAPVELPAAFAEIAGNYRIDEIATDYSIILHEERLLASTLWSVDEHAKRQLEWSLWSPTAIPLVAVGPDRFESNSYSMGAVKVLRNPAGGVTGLEIVAGGLSGTQFRRQ